MSLLYLLIFKSSASKKDYTVDLLLYQRAWSWILFACGYNIFIVFRDSVVFQIQMNASGLDAFRATLFMTLASTIIDFGALILLINLHCNI